MSNDVGAVGTVEVDTANLKEIEIDITTLGDTIKTLKANNGDKDELTKAINDLLVAKKLYATNNNGIGIDGKPYEEPLTKAQQKAKAKADKAAAAATAQAASAPVEGGTVAVDSSAGVAKPESDSKGARDKNAKKAEKAAKKAAYKTPGGVEEGAVAAAAAGTTLSPASAVVPAEQTTAKVDLTNKKVAVTKATTTAATTSVSAPVVPTSTTTASTGTAGIGIKPGPLQIIINPNVSLIERPIIAISVACLLDTIIDYQLISDHRCHRTCMGTSSTSGTSSNVVVGDVAMARYIARRATNDGCTKNSTTLYPSNNISQLGLIETWVDYAISLQGYSEEQKIAAVTMSIEHTLVTTDQTYIVGNAITLADLCLYALIGFPIQVQDVQECLSSKINVNALATRRWIHMMSNHPALQQATQYCIGIVQSATEPVFDSTTHLDSLVSGMNPLEGALAGRVVTRFPPEPSGYLHIGHAKACLLNDYYAKRYHGRLLVRFDDTNPSKEKEEYQESIVTDLAKLGVQPDLITFTSDYFSTIHGYAVYMIQNGLAFMDDTPQEQMQKERRACEESIHRNQSPEDGLQYFHLMCTGTAENGGQWCLRAKIDMSSDNGTLRDPVLFRQNLQPHHRSGTTYRAYPTYDLACPIVDSIEGVTTALRTTEYDDRTAQYYWFQKVLHLRRTKLHTFSRVNFKNTVLSKRKLTWFVDSDNVTGWDDPRFPTVRGVVRRGINIQALRNFMYSQGASKRVVLMDWTVFWSENKKEIDKLAKRYMAIGSTANVVLTITNAPSQSEYSYVETSYHPKDPTLGSRVLRICNEVLLETVDVEGMIVNEEIVLLRWGVVKITSVDTDTSTGTITKLTGTLIPDGDYKAAKRKISWLANVTSNINVTLTEFDNLISKDKLEDTDDFKDYINPKTIATSTVIGDALLKELQYNDVIQLERRGYYRCDCPYQNPSKPLILFMIPDGKSKPMSGQTGQLAHR